MTETIIVNESTPENTAILILNSRKAIVKKIILSVAVVAAVGAAVGVIKNVADSYAEAE